MAYTPQYTTSDVTAASVDGITVFIITVVSLAGIFALIFAYKYARKNMKF